MRVLLLVVILFSTLLLLPSQVVAQDTMIAKSRSKYAPKENKNINELKKAFDTNDEVAIAKNYEKIGQEFKDKGENAKAEEYFAKALIIYKKLNLTKDKPRATRNLAKVQESQKKYDDAIQNYQAAGNAAEDRKTEMINSNDAQRLRNVSNPRAQSNLIKEKLQILENETQSEIIKEEVTTAYKQQAQISLQQSNKAEAIINYKKAIDYAKDKPKEIIHLRNEIAKVYASDNELGKALEINNKLLLDARNRNDFETQIIQLHAISRIFLEKKQEKKGIDALKKAYELSVKNGKTTLAKNSLSQLLQYYKSIGKEKESIALYADFFNKFDELIKVDTTLINAKTFQITEQKIKQLEKEKELKDQLIAKKNTFNYFLLASMVVLLLFFGLIAKALFSIKKKNKEIALQSLRREMNPHFIFNSLNSVNQFIAENKELEANKYLTSYSYLMRKIMENSNKDFISMSAEIEQLKKYLDLEHLRFQDKFDFKIHIDDTIDTETTLVPNMIIQPHLENAIWHGLRYLEGKGKLELSFLLEQEKITVLINDDGIGLTKSLELKTRNQKIHESRGLTNTKERIALLNDLYNKKISFRIEEKKLPETGTQVTINFPLINTTS
jgi:two-component system sensor histidine kinase YesM